MFPSGHYFIERNGVGGRGSGSGDGSGYGRDPEEVARLWTGSHPRTQFVGSL